MHSLQVFLCVFCVAVGFQAAQAALGGGTCTIPAVGGGPGASTVCTAAANGFCLLDHISVAGSPVTGVTYDGVCVCYTGYSGPQCATASPTTSTTTTSNNNAVTALVLGGLGAYLLSQVGQGGSAYGAETGAQAAQEALYLQQAGFGVGK